MNFKEALGCMKQGCAVLLPEWGGYWAWDAERKTINMHCKDGSIVDMRDTPDMEFTLSHTFRDDWKILVNRKNTEHYKARSQPVGASVSAKELPNKAECPFRDYAGQIIYEGDEIIHPSGECGTVVFNPALDDPNDAWKVSYSDSGSELRLCLQVGDKGCAVVSDASITARESV